MKKNGFTLIELLAVIVILAIISLIATPIILNIIEDAQEESNQRSMELFGDAVANEIATFELKNNAKPTENQFKELVNNMKNNGGKVECEESELYEDGTYYLGECSINNSDKKYSYGEKQVGPVSFATDEWSTIVANLNSDVYKVGDTREIALKNFENTEKDANGNNIGTYTIRIANKSNDDIVCTNEKFETSSGTEETYSKTACGFVIEFVDIIAKHKMNDTDSNVGGYPVSSMYTYIKNDIYNSLPDDLKSVISTTTVVSGHDSTSGETNFVSEDKLYLLSPKEVWGSNPGGYDSAADNTRQLDYYSGLGVTASSKYSGAIKTFDGNANSWWLRSADSCYFYGVLDYGDWHSSNATVTSGVAVAFRIG